MKAGLKRWIGRVPDISDVVTRFPIAVAAMAVFTVIIILLDDLGLKEEFGRALAGLVIAAYLCVCITLARKGRGLSRLLPLQILIAIGLFAVMWFSESLRINIPMAIGAVLLILGNVVIWRQSRDDLHVWDFTHKIWTGAVFATVGSIIFTIGVFAISEALKSLFGINIRTLIERFLLPIGLGFLAPLYWLSTVPQTDESYEELLDNPGFVSKAVAFLGTWILAPLTLIYALILLAYGAKIALAWNLPKGEIAQLTTPFLIIGTLTWLALEPPFVKGKALAKLFRKVWFPVSIPAAILLAIAVFVRIREYGLTPERIALAMAVIWALAIGLWFTFGRREKRDIRLIPGLASALLVIGALGAGWASIGNQYMRLEDYLQKAGISAESDVEIKDVDAARKAKGAMSYLKGHNGEWLLEHALSHIGYYPEGDFDLDYIYKDLKLDKIIVPSLYRNGHQSQSYQRGKRPMDIEGFSRLYGPYNYYATDKDVPRQDLVTIDGVKVTIEGGELVFKQSGTRLDTYNIKSWFDNLDLSDAASSDTQHRFIVLDDGSRRVIFQAERINLWPNDNLGNMSGNMDFYLLADGF